MDLLSSQFQGHIGNALGSLCCLVGWFHKQQIEQSSFLTYMIIWVFFSFIYLFICLFVCLFIYFSRIKVK